MTDRTSSEEPNAALIVMAVLPTELMRGAQESYAPATYDLGDVGAAAHTDAVGEKTQGDEQKNPSGVQRPDVSPRGFAGRRKASMIS